MQSVLAFCVDVFTLQQGRFVTYGAIETYRLPAALQFYCHNWEQFLRMTLSVSAIAEIPYLRTSVLRAIQSQGEGLRCARMAMGDEAAARSLSQIGFFDHLYTVLSGSVQEEALRVFHVNDLIRALADAMDMATRIRHRIDCDEDLRVEGTSLGFAIHRACVIHRAIHAQGDGLPLVSYPCATGRLFKTVIVPGSHAPAGSLGPFALPSLVGVRRWLSAAEAWKGQGGDEPAADVGLQQEAWKYGCVGRHEDGTTAFAGQSASDSEAQPYGVIGEPRRRRCDRVEQHQRGGICA